MRKIFILFSILFFVTLKSDAINFGMYHPEEDYGLLDGIKLNFGKNKNETGKAIQLRSEDPIEQAKLKKEKEAYEKNKDQKADDEYQMFKFMLDDTIAF